MNAYCVLSMNTVMVYSVKAYSFSLVSSAFQLLAFLDSGATMTIHH